jgi:hypothetical protein
MSYQELSDYLQDTFDIIAIESEMQEIERILEKKRELDSLPSFYELPDDCAHQDRHIKVISIGLGCETTVIACVDCGKHLTEPKTDF